MRDLSAFVPTPLATLRVGPLRFVYSYPHGEPVWTVTPGAAACCQEAEPVSWPATTDVPVTVTGRRDTDGLEGWQAARLASCGPVVTIRGRGGTARCDLERRAISVDSASARGLLRVTRVFASLLLPDIGCLLLHATAVRRPDGAVWVFSGPSSVGKSTLCGLMPREPGWLALTDESAVVAPAAPGFWAGGTPFASTAGVASPEGGPLREAYLLEQAPRHEVVPVGRDEAFRRLFAEVLILTEALEPELTRRITGRVMDNVAAVVSGVDVRTLRFAPTPDLWDTLS